MNAIGKWVHRQKIKRLLKKAEKRHARILLRVRAENPCPKCDQKMPYLTKMYSPLDSAGVQGNWFASLVCSRLWCLTAWTVRVNMDI